MTRSARPLQAVPDPPATDLDALEAISAAVDSGAGLPEVVRAAARALDASLALLDASGSVLAVAARSEADEASLVAAAHDVDVQELVVAHEIVGRLHVRTRVPPSPPILSLVRTLIAAEVRRVQAPGRAAEEAAGSFLRAILERVHGTREDLVAAAGDLDIELQSGGTMVVVRAHPLVPTEGDWRARVVTVSERGARGAVPGAIAARGEAVGAGGGESWILVPGDDEEVSRKAGQAVLRELETNLKGFTFAVGRSRVADDPMDLHRAGHEGLLAANVADAQSGSTLLAFEETGAYRLLLPAMSEDPEELQRFYAETLEPLVAYDEQYETDLVQTLETYFEADGNVAGTASKLFTHRHTVRYRLERVKELSGLDVGSTEGREKLSLGLKAMRVLGVAAPRGPATEAGAEGGRVPEPPEKG